MAAKVSTEAWTGTTVTTAISNAPGHDRFIAENGSKGVKMSLESAAHSSADTLLLQSAAVATTDRLTPGYHGAIAKIVCCTFVSWSCTAVLSSPQPGRPQVTTDPSPRMAAKAPPEAWICCTVFS
ncbi:unnamed protein product [Symbiodinium sp. KB8]|nr:unnamed protein product [Symbiodinium sp. KB8]